MSKTAFAQTIIGKLKSAIGTDGLSYTTGSASVAMVAVAQGITEYILANTTVTISYSGMLTTTPPAPDPVVTDTFKVAGSCAPTGPSNNFDDWIRKIESNIIAGFVLAPMGTAGVVFPTKAFLNPGIATAQSILKALHDVQDEACQPKVWEEVCQGIMNWINTTALNVVPGAASRPSGPSSGIGTIVNVTIT